MMIIKDSMVIIHLAKMTLLETSCRYFGKVFIPFGVKREVLNRYADSHIIEELISKDKIVVKNVKNIKFVKRAYEFDIQDAEAEAVALYWELNADFIATDDNNIRKKAEILKINLIGTPAIILKLYKEKRIDKLKLQEAIKKLKAIGWFSNSVWDKIQMEVNKNG